VLAHLRQEPPDWRRGQRTLEKLFSSQEKQRKQLLSDALNLVQKGKVRAERGATQPPLRWCVPLTPRPL